MIREDHHDIVYKNVRGKYRAVVEQIKECNAKGQPVLVGTVSIDKSEELSRLLKKEKIAHTVLNAKYHEKEAEIVAQAGKLGAVTISTNMAGRGTDIMLGGNPEYMAKSDMRKMGVEEDLIAAATGTKEIDDEGIKEARRIYTELYEKHRAAIAPEAEKVRAAGGLFILGTERHESRRIDNQLRGRSGRQGDAGESRFYLSLEDDLMRLFGSERIMGIVETLGIDEDTPIDAKMLSNSIEGAQKRIEDQNFKRRKYVLSYDDVMNQQRTVIYKQRRDVLDGNDVSQKIRNMINGTIEETVAKFTTAEENTGWNIVGIKNEYKGLLCSDEDFVYTEEELKSLSREDIIDKLVENAEKLYKEKEELFGAEQFREVERAILLQSVDRSWMEHIEAMDDLKGSINLQAYAQRDPVVEYRMQGADMFDAMVSEIRERTVRMILSVFPRASAPMRVEVARATSAGFEGDRAQRKAVARPRPVEEPRREPIVKNNKVGRNDPCPCGSGKKYKKCCGANQGEAAEND